jgi:hypothetical protein
LRALSDLPDPLLDRFFESASLVAAFLKLQSASLWLWTTVVGFLGADLLRGIVLVLLILLWDTTSLHCFSSFEISLLHKGFLKPLLFGSFLTIFYLKMIEIIQEGLVTYHALAFILLIKLVLH